MDAGANRLEKIADIFGSSTAPLNSSTPSPHDREEDQWPNITQPYPQIDRTPCTRSDVAIEQRTVSTSTQPSESTASAISSTAPMSANTSVSTSTSSASSIPSFHTLSVQ